LINFFAQNGDLICVNYLIKLKVLKNNFFKKNLCQKLLKF